MTRLRLNKASRSAYAKAGIALPDGKFPIPDKAHLRAAIAYRNKSSDPPARVLAHIRKRAKDLGVAVNISAAGAPKGKYGRSSSLKWPWLFDKLVAKGYDHSKAAAISNSRIGMRKNGRLNVLQADEAHSPAVLRKVAQADKDHKHRTRKQLTASARAGSRTYEFACHSAACADLRPQFRADVEEFFNKSQPRDKNGMWTVGVQHVASKANAEAIAREGFKIDAVDKWDQSFGPGLYFAEEGDVKSAKFYARQGSGRDTHSSQVISAELSLRNPAHFDIRTHADFRQQATTTLGGREKLVELAQAKYDEAVKVTRQAFTSELKKDNPDAFSQLDLKHPEQAFLWDFSQEAVDRAVNKIKSKTGLSLDQIGDWKALAERPEDVLRSGPTASDNWTHQSANIGILLRDAGYDGIVLNTKNWGGIGGTQVVVFNPSSIRVKGVRPYDKRQKSIQAAAYAYFRLCEHGSLTAACHDDNGVEPSVDIVPDNPDGYDEEGPRNLGPAPTLVAAAKRHYG